VLCKHRKVVRQRAQHACIQIKLHAESVVASSGGRLARNVMCAALPQNFHATICMHTHEVRFPKVVNRTSHSTVNCTTPFGTLREAVNAGGAYLCHISGVQPYIWGAALYLRCSHISGMQETHACTTSGMQGRQCADLSRGLPPLGQL